MAYQINKYTDSQLKEVTTLLDQTFGINSDDKISLIRWKYHSLHKNNAIIYLASDDQSNIVSHYANLPVSIEFKTDVFQCGICVDMATDSMHRGKGLISQLSQAVYRDVVRTKRTFSIGFSNEYGVLVDKYAKNYGYTIVGKFVNYFALSLIKRKTPFHVSVLGDVDTIPHDPDLPFFRIHKTRAYVSWRYLEKPNKDYRIYSVRSDTDQIAIVILRIKSGKCYVHDIISSDNTPSTMRKILQTIENIAVDKKIKFVVVPILENNYWRRIFFRTHFMKERTKKTHRYLTVKIHKKTFALKKEVMDKNNWVLMNGDIL